MDLPPFPCPDQPNPYTVLARDARYDSPWIRVREDRFRHRQGAEGHYAVCGFQRTACGVLALDAQDRVMLVGQWRYPLEAYSWELPEGGGDVTESPFEAIQRELAEEAGLAARVWEPLCFFHPSNSSTDEEAFLFLATDLIPADGHASEPDEELMLHWEPLAHCLRRVLSGEITDSLTAMALFALHARRTGVAQPMQPDLAERFFQRPETHPSAGRKRWEALAP